MAGGYLRNPRVRVFWGDINLSSYTGGNGIPSGNPLVYDVQVDVSSENEGPRATMKWDPTGPGMAVYESLVSNETYLKSQITIEFFYSDGKKITFIFVWSGQSINYGNNMDITVKMQSELAGLINANLRSTAQAYDENSGSGMQEVIDKTIQQYGLKGYPNIVQYGPGVTEQLAKIKILNAYGKDWTFGANMAHLAKQGGYTLFPNNIGQTNVVFFAPYSWEGGKELEAVNPVTAISPATPEANQRYGYILGPSLIDTLTRESDWKPPQQSQSKSPNTQPFPSDPAKASTTTRTPPSNAQTAESDESAAAAPTSAPLGASNGASNPNLAFKENPEGPARMIAINQEKMSTLTLSTMMVPLLCGIKPNDIIYIPSLTGSYIEDWIVQSVGYRQTNGGVELSIQGSRVYGQGTPMNELYATQFQDLANGLGLTGPNATLEAWDRYAWGTN